MIRIFLLLNSRRCLTELTVQGHAAKGERESSIPCAAVSALTGTVARLIDTCDGIISNGSAAKPGEMQIRIKEIEEKSNEWLQGVTDFLVFGLKEVEREYPRECSVLMKIQEE